MNGSEVRDTRFMRGIGGYDMSEVDDILDSVAAELDCDRDVGPLIRNAAFRQGRLRTGGYDIDAVDWFLDQLVLRRGDAEPDGMSPDPWRDLAVTQLTRSGGGRLADRSAEPSQRDRPRYLSVDRRHFSEECGNGWRDFGLVPGMHLQWRWVGVHGELRTAEEQMLASVTDLQWTKASLRGVASTVSAGGRSLGLKRTAATRSSSPGIAEVAARGARIHTGQFLRPRSGRKQQRDSPGRVAVALNELVDETGTPILYTSGENFGCRACACISFPDQRWLRFLVRGTNQADAIMTAIDHAGNKIIRYRNIRTGLVRPATVQITVHPQQVLTDELMLAIAISARWLGWYFVTPGGGG